MSVTALIAEDEPLLRAELRELLDKLWPELVICAEVEDGFQALQALERYSPQILFLDIQMPELDGFEVVGALTQVAPLIIFTSAWDDYALRAFEVHAFDYLLKPFDGRRFLESLRRAKARVAKDRSGAPDSRISELFRSFSGFSNVPRAPDRIAVRNNGRVVFLKLDDIDWIEASDNYVCLHCGQETHLVRQTMSELEEQLDPAKFLRVHRSTIVNLDRIRELQPWFRGDYRVILRDGTELTLTKSHREKLESKLLMGAVPR